MISVKKNLSTRSVSDFCTNTWHNWQNPSYSRSAPWATLWPSTRPPWLRRSTWRQPSSSCWRTQRPRGRRSRTCRPGKSRIFAKNTFVGICYFGLIPLGLTKPTGQYFSCRFSYKKLSTRYRWLWEMCDFLCKQQLYDTHTHDAWFITSPWGGGKECRREAPFVAASDN